MMPEKRCPQCGETKPLTVEHWSSRKRDLETGEIIRFAGWCRTCHNAKQRARRASWTEEQHEERRAYMRAQYELNMRTPAEREKRNAKERAARMKPPRRESVKRAQRRWYENLKADPVRYAAYLETRRIEQGLRRELKTGQIEGNRRNRRGTHNPWTPAVGNTAGLGGGHVEPLALWLETVLAEHVAHLGGAIVERAEDLWPDVKKA
jgi:hypothetical protein